MVDTVIILLSWGKYKIVDHGMFSPSTENLSSFGIVPGTDFKNNATKEQQNLHYYPRLTLYTTPYYAETRVLKIECSIHKLINDGNNINEYEQKDFAIGIANLERRLRERGVLVPHEYLLEAPVVGFHVGKNILLSGGFTATSAIEEIAKIDVSKRKDTNKADYRNEGHVFQVYTKSHSLVLYDKFADVRKTKGRAIDKDQSSRQLSLLDKVENDMIKHKLLRLEVRMSNKKYVNKTVVKFGFEPNPTLKDILSIDLSKQILNQYWSDLYNPRNRFVLDYDTSPMSIFKRTLHHDPSITPRKALQATGYHLVAKHVGMRRMRSVIRSYRPTADWNKLKQDLRIYESPPFPIRSHGFVADIERELDLFSPYSIKLSCEEKQSILPTNNAQI